MKKEQVIKAAAIAAVILISGVFYTVKQQSETGAAKAAVVHTEESVRQEETENTQNVTGQEEQKALCYVYICGAVVSPGVYEVPEHTRIYEVVELADGFTPEADDTVLNLAENVLDGQKLYIPKQGEVTEKADTAQETPIFTNGALKIDYAAGCAYLDGAELHLTPIEYKLLCLLSKNVGKVLTHTYITQQIWGSSWENDIASLRVFMATLRKKLENGKDGQQYIQTHIGIGYRMLRVE